MFWEAPAVCVPDPVMANLLPVAAETVKLLLVARVNEPSVPVNVKVPDFVGTRLEKFATPPEAATVVVELPSSTPPPLIAIVTLELSVLTRFPPKSCT